MKNLVLLLLLLANIICFSQSVSIYDIETSSFPIIKAKFNVFDKDGNIVRPNKSELKLSENGIKREIVTTNCPDVTPPKTVSIAMSIDISGSMGYSNFGDLPVELGKKTATELCKLIAMPPSQFALQTCHGTAFILNDFTTNKNKILDLITPIRAGGDNNFVEHLLNERTGILNIAKLGKNKRIAIVYTDAWWYQLSKSELERCINICKEYDIEFYAVIYSRPEAEPNGIKASLQALCNASGGYMYDGITSEEAALELSRRIQKEVQLVEPCTIEWKSGPACVSNDIKVDLEWNKTVGSTSYKSGSNSIPTLQYSSKFLAFGKVLPNQKSTKTIKITAKNADCNILNIVSDEPSFTAINTTFPILIAENQTKEFTIQYAPLDSNLKYVTIDVINDNCPSSFSANGGFPGKFGTKKLKVTHPNGGEQFVVGSDTNITWTGIGRNDEVSIELSRDEGKTWKEINNLATGLKADWKNIEKPVGNKCLIKVKQNAQDGGSDTSANTVVSLENGTEWVYSIAWSDLGDKIVSTSNDNKVRVWNVKEKRILATLDKHTSEVKAVAYSSDGSKFATGSSEAIAVWDAQNYQLVQFIPAQNITGLAWDNTSSQVCGVSETDFIKIWEVSTGKELQKLQWSSLAKYYSVDWSSDNQQIACGNADGNITLFSPSTGKILKTLTGHDEQINSVCWSPEGDKLVSGSDDFSIKIWDVAKGSAIKTITDFDGFVYMEC